MVEENQRGTGKLQLTFGEWLNNEMTNQKVTIQDLANKSGITYTGIWNIVKGNTMYPRKETRKSSQRRLTKPSQTISSLRSKRSRR